MPVNVITVVNEFPAAVAPGQVVAKLLGEAITNPAGRVSVRFGAPLRVSVLEPFVFPMVIVKVVVVPATIDGVPKALVTVGG